MYIFSCEQFSRIISESSMSSQQISDKAGLTQNTVYRIASGRNTNPTVDTITSVCNVLNIHPGSLFVLKR